MDATRDEPPSVASGELVLRGARKGHAARYFPHASAGDEATLPAATSRVLCQRASFDQLGVLEHWHVDPGGVADIATRVRAGDHLAAELLRLLDRVNGDIAGAGDHDGSPVKRVAARGQHVLNEVGAAVPGGLGAHLSAAPAHALAGEHAWLVAVGDPLVLAEQVADLPLPTPMSPAGTSVCSPTWRYNSVMNAWQKRITSASDRPLGSKSEPPLAPPIGIPVSAFLNT